MKIQQINGTETARQLRPGLDPAVIGIMHEVIDEHYLTLARRLMLSVYPHLERAIFAENCERILEGDVTLPVPSLAAFSRDVHRPPRQLVAERRGFTPPQTRTAGAAAGCENFGNGSGTASV